MDMVAAAADPNVTLSLYLTGTGESGPIQHGRLPNRTLSRRLHEADLKKVLDGYKDAHGAEHTRSRTVAYVCGPPMMTDSLVAFLQQQPGMAKERVLCEKWW